VISSLISSMTPNHGAMFCSVSRCLRIFCYLFLSCRFILLWSHFMQEVISIFSYLLRLTLWSKIWSVLEKFHGLLRKMYIVLLLDGILSRHLSGPFDLWCHSILKFLCWILVSMTYLLVIEEYWSLPLSLYRVYLCF
jgi:hypothetical protein